MMKHEGQEGKKVSRFGRPQRSRGIYGDGLSLEGVTSKFGLLGIALLIIVGIAMIAISGTPTMDELSPVNIEVQAPAYRTPKAINTVLLPLTHAKVLALDPAAFSAADTTQLFTLKKGEKLIAWLEKEDAVKWNEGVARKDFYKAMLLQKEDKTWIVDYPSFRKKSMAFNNQGWWIILLGAILIPYQLISKPKIPVWVTIAAFITAIIVWNFS
jgi:hypothetical protein